MTPKQFIEFKEIIKTEVSDTINTTVNGKINDLRKVVNEYIEDDKKWKEEVTPSIQRMKEFQGFTTVGATLLKTIMLIGGAVGVIYGLFVFIKEWVNK